MTQTVPLSSLARIPAQQAAGAPRIRPEPAPAAVSRPPEGAAPAATESRSDTAPKPLLSGGNQLTAQEAAADEKSGSGGTADPAGTGTGEDLSEEEKKKVQELQSRDREVRAHEQAHKLAGGPYAGHPSFKTVRGPDGRSYAVSGEVKIDTSEVPNNPDATIRKLETVKRAALAPSNPSAKDRQVAAEAEAKIPQARQEKRENEQEAQEEAGITGPIPPSASGPGSAGKAVTPGTLFNLVA